MAIYLITEGEYSDYGVDYIVRAKDMSEGDLRKYQLEAVKRKSLYHDGRMEKIANYLGIPERRSNWDYRQAVGHEKFEEAQEVLGYGVFDCPDFLGDILKENGIEVLEYTEYNLDDL